MSAAILMTDSWQPTVLQLMPFSSNNASQKQCLSSLSDDERAYAKSRGFPTLAVTRSRRTKNGGKPVRVSSERMPRSHPISGRSTPPQRAKSEYNSRVKGTLVTQDNSYLANNVTRTIHRAPDPSDSLTSTEGRSAVDVSRNVKMLPKPSPSNAFDGRYFLPQNGFWRSVSMTPGEMELQKHRIVLDKEQNRCKKYKLSVSQLPRSTTPINDHDPDKLNMKQVIRFLQTREGDIPGRVSEGKKSDRRVKSGYPSTTPSKSSLRTSSDNMVVNDLHCTSPLRREVTTVVYTSNISTSPLIKKRGQKFNRDATHGDTTSKSVDGNRPSFKTTREFRLHRFLTMAPSSVESSSSANRTRQIHPVSSAQRRLIVTETSKSLDSAHEPTNNGYGPVLHYAASRQAGQYPRLHYRLPNRRSETAFHTYESTKRFHANNKKTADLVVEGIIRLPSMLDNNNESDNDEEDGVKAKLRVRDFSSMSISSECLSIDANARGSESPVSMKDLPSDSETSSKPFSRKVTVSIPRATIADDTLTNSRSPDPVRLIMRQGGSFTRENTYMSDMATQRSDLEGCGLSSPFSTHASHQRDNKFDDE